MLFGGRIASAKISAKKVEVTWINTNAWIDEEAMEKYKEVEHLKIMEKAAENGWVWSDTMSAWLGMAMWAKMVESLTWDKEKKEKSMEEKLEELKKLFDKKLISKDDYEAKKKEILEKM